MIIYTSASIAAEQNANREAGPCQAPGPVPCYDPGCPEREHDFLCSRYAGHVADVHIALTNYPGVGVIIAGAWAA